MPMWFFKCLVQLLLILHLPYFLSAQFLQYPNAAVSTLWTVPEPSTEPILLRVINNHQFFACGFHSNGGDGSFIFAIGIQYYYLQNGGFYNHFGHYEISGPEIVWVSNRNKLIRENGTLHFQPDGDLVLRDVDGTLVWSTNTSHKSVVGMSLMKNGNLVIYDRYNRTVWQSFDHPADTLLNGQKLIAGKKLVSRISPTNWTEGDYYLTVTSQGLFGFYQSSIPQLYFKFLVQGSRESMETSYVKAVNGMLALYISTTEPSEPDAVFSKQSSMEYIRLDNDGHLRVYIYENEPVDLLADFLSECDYPTVCGNFGLCSKSNGSCSCPGGFTPANASKSTSGCLEINQTNCNDSHELLQITDAYYFNYVDTDAAVLKGTDVESCKQACLRNCSCKTVLFRYFLNLSHGNCFLPSPVLSLISGGKEKTLYQSSAFFKISKNPGNEVKPSRSVYRTGVIVGSSVGAFLITLVTVGIWVVFLRKKRKTEEDGDDYFDQLSGLPQRFSYEELKVATGNFQTKLGGGGFGSVFEGFLINGEKIAVKRLDGLGQGKKEFLAEVKTIGSIHHVNLVRLIGFCAENFQRLLVYEFMGNGSLDRWIFRTNRNHPTLDWQSRNNIILDIAKGLAYLHEECRQRIVHLDIKPQNILLDAHLHAKVSDFGLSKLIDRDQSQVVTTMRGTPGYLAPEWLSSAITEKVDVYSFGIVVMETMSGRKNLDRSQPEECMHLLRLFMRKAEEDQLIDLVDKYSEDMQLHLLEAAEMMRLAAWCLQLDFTRRPSMSMVVKVIEGTMEMEANLDYSFLNGTTMVAINEDSEPVVTATLLPSILSGPR